MHSQACDTSDLNDHIRPSLSTMPRSERSRIIVRLPAELSMQVAEVVS